MRVDEKSVLKYKEKQIQVLEKLIQDNLERLEIAKEVEKEKKFIFPETTVICKLIMQIYENINVINGVVVKDDRMKTKNKADENINDLKLDLDLEI